MTCSAAASYESSSGKLACDCDLLRCSWWGVVLGDVCPALLQARGNLLLAPLECVVDDPARGCAGTLCPEPQHRLLDEAVGLPGSIPQGCPSSTSPFSLGPAKWCREWLRFRR